MRSQRWLVAVCTGIAVLVCIHLYSASPRFSTSAIQRLDSEGTAGVDVVGHRGHDVHMQQIDLSGRTRKTEYPRRQNMSTCPPLFGKVVVFVAYVKSSMKTHYKVAQSSLHCYLKTVNYKTVFVDLDEDLRVNQACYKNKQLFFKKHCAASVYLADADWMLVLDADTGVVNPNHCIEEWIDDRVDLILYERFFNWEIASGNYLVRNSAFSMNFLKKWADWEHIQPSNWNGADNGVLQIHVLQTVLPDAQQEIRNCDEIWHKGTDYDTYMAYVTCVKVYLGATRLWPGKIRILRRGHGWVRDGFLTGDAWCEHDFMFHGWKAQQVGQDGWKSPFTNVLDPSACGNGLRGWPMRPEKKITAAEVRIHCKRISFQIRKMLSDFETSGGNNFPEKARVLPYLSEPDVGVCYPHCDDAT